MQIYVIRHGLSDANAAGTIQGHADCPLSDIGRTQANLLGRYFHREGITPDTIFSSPLKRAYDTSQIITGELDPKPIVVRAKGLMEVDVGSLSGLTLEEAYKKYPSGWTLDVNRWLDFSKAGGESFEKFYDRVEGCVREIMSEWDDLLADRTVLFVAHAGVMRPLLKTLLNANSDFMYFAFRNCCHVKLEYRPVRDSVRRVLCDLIRIEKVAELMGEPDPRGESEDQVSKKLG